ncbi:hypothetical protein SBRY_20459 [Actinacidiphila bryophytorum]|uniref:Uncharacterized protein n=1 Tax=Actinacidiphila bryophytorum TaxID=1436133 RepID=A0A9W4H023_9ACTN|nr:hypothetical protein SBRY_20459 [Actinacidiphila bryophytorum]
MAGAAAAGDAGQDPRRPRGDPQAARVGHRHRAARLPGRVDHPLAGRGRQGQPGRRAGRRDRRGARLSRPGRPGRPTRVSPAGQPPAPR